MSKNDAQVQAIRARYGDAWGDFAQRWTRLALRTTPIERTEIAAAIAALYRRAGLSAPRVVVVPSPGAMAFAGTLAAYVWERRTTDAAFDPIVDPSAPYSVPAEFQGLAAATQRAVQEATSPRTRLDNGSPPAQVWDATLESSYAPADVATVGALDQAKWLQARDALEALDALSYWHEALRDAMRDAFGGPRPTDVMAAAMREWSIPLARLMLGSDADAERVVSSASDWWRESRAGNLGLYDTACIAAARDVHQLRLSAHEAFADWESAATGCGYQYLHPEFCLVSDFPEALDETRMRHPTQVRSRPLEERRASPGMRWRDGWVI